MSTLIVDVDHFWKIHMLKKCAHLNGTERPKMKRKWRKMSLFLYWLHIEVLVDMTIKLLVSRVKWTGVTLSNGLSLVKRQSTIHEKYTIQSNPNQSLFFSLQLTICNFEWVVRCFCLFVQLFIWFKFLLFAFCFFFFFFSSFSIEFFFLGSFVSEFLDLQRKTCSFGYLSLKYNECISFDIRTLHIL